MLDKETATALVKSGVGRLYVSLDGPKEIQNKIRGNLGAYDYVQNGLEYLVDFKKKLERKTPEIIINSTISSSNVDFFEQIIPIGEKIGVDTIEFEYVGEFKEENIQNTNIEGIKPTPFYITLDSSHLLSREQAYLLKKKMRYIKELAKSSNMKITTHHIDVLTIDNFTQGTIPNKKCYYCRYTVTIDPYGNLMGCIHFNNYLLGNIKNVPFSSIWNNKHHRSFLKFQKEGKIKICKNCISGVHRNLTLFQSLYRKMYLRLKAKGFDEP
jgi:MoaA/NifB/PqqE/SkfB family radical SAM enzyme